MLPQPRLAEPPNLPNRPPVPAITGYDWAGWVIAAVALLLILPLHLLAAMLSGMLVYELSHVLVRLIHRRFITRAAARLLAVLLVAAIIVSLIALGVGGLVGYFRGGSESVPALLQKIAEIIEGSRDMLPMWLWTYLPTDADELRAKLVDWLRENAGTLQGWGQAAGHIIAYMLIGMVIGALLSMVEIDPNRQRRPLAQSLVERATRLHNSFRRVIVAQGLIATINAVITWLYLAVALPLLGIHLPLIKTMIAVTFVAGLIPIIGNLISNTVIVVVALSYSPYVAVASLIYLIAVHKLGYLLNAKIVGSYVNAEAWELLLAMLVGEAAFGIAGLIAAPLYYAYLKDELSAKGLV